MDTTNNRSVSNAHKKELKILIVDLGSTIAKGRCTQIMHVTRVFHIPYLTLYTRKIASSHIKAVNAYEGFSDRSIYLQRPFLQEELDSFDVVHLHSLRYGTVQGFKVLLEQCIDKRKRIVFTAHDLWSLRDDEAIHHEKLRLVCSLADVVITLTKESAEKLTQLVDGVMLAEKLSVIPHGFAIHPHHPNWGISGSQDGIVRYALHGGFRLNRDILGFAQTWYNALQGTDAQLNILLQTPDSSLVNSPQMRVKETLAFIYARKHSMSITLAPAPSDEQIIRFLSHNDVLAMPYRWGTHSGQLEMAFDLNMLPLSTPVGFFSEQWRWVQSYQPEPFWFDLPMDDTNNLPLQERLLEVQCSVHNRKRRTSDKRWKSYRLWEHQGFIQAHYQLYCGAQAIWMVPRDDG